MASGSGRQQQSALGAWESEGGHLAGAVPSPPAIETSLREEYRVGPYRYTDRACAEVELRRQQANLIAPTIAGIGKGRSHV